MNARCRVTGSRTFEPQHHHSTQEHGPSKASRVSVRSSGAPRLGSRASRLAGRPARPTDHIVRRHRLVVELDACVDVDLVRRRVGSRNSHEPRHLVHEGQPVRVDHVHDDVDGRLDHLLAVALQPEGRLVYTSADRDGQNGNSGWNVLTGGSHVVQESAPSRTQMSTTHAWRFRRLRARVSLVIPW